MSNAHNKEHEFKSSWRWPEQFEKFVKRVVDEHPQEGPTINVFAGLSPLGDIRLDLRTPLELIKPLQEDDTTGLEEAKEYLKPHIRTPYESSERLSPDIIRTLYESESPEDEPAAKYVKTDTTIRTDILSGQLPIPSNTASVVVADPPWKKMSTDDKTELFENLIDILRPGGILVFNAYWAPTDSDLPATLDFVTTRQDVDRYPGGFPNCSLLGVYTKWPSTNTAKYLSRTLSADDREYIPSAGPGEMRSLRKEYRLYMLDGVDPGTHPPEILNIDSETECVKCGCPDLRPLNTDDVTLGGDPLYQCHNPECGFRQSKAELQSQISESPPPSTEDVTNYAT